MSNTCILYIYIYPTQEVDKQLKLVCEKFISDVSSSLVDPFKTLLSKFDVIFALASKDNLDIGTLVHQQPFAVAGIDTKIKYVVFLLSLVS